MKINRAVSHVFRGAADPVALYRDALDKEVDSTTVLERYDVDYQPAYAGGFGVTVGELLASLVALQQGATLVDLIDEQRDLARLSLTDAERAHHDHAFNVLVEAAHLYGEDAAVSYDDCEAGEPLDVAGETIWVIL